MQLRSNINSILRIDLLSIIANTLSTSHQMIAELQAVAEADSNDDVDAIMAISSKNKFIGVAAFMSGSAKSSHSFKIKMKRNGTFIYDDVDSNSPSIEALCYPLLFPSGEIGYDPRGKNIRLHQYVASRLLCPEPQLGYINNGKMDVPLNRFNIMARLTQYWLCETLSRAINYRLSFLKSKQESLFGIAYNRNDIEIGSESGSEDSDDDDNGDGDRFYSSSRNKTFLADSLTGSPRHLKMLSMNALTIVSELGPPDAFITLTFNPLWSEVEEILHSNQSIFDRPDIQARVFHARLEAFLKNLREGKYYQDAKGHALKLKYLLRVIEYQNRGLPHCHIVIKLDQDYNPINFMNMYCRSTTSDLDDLNDRDSQVKSLIQQHMLHKCSDYCCSPSTGGVCRKKYGRNEIIESNSVDNRGFPVHKRLSVADCNIVPTHDLMILDWEGHINHEPAAQRFTVLYLFKYLFKGSKKESIEIRKSRNIDEIKEYAYGKMLSASDAAWRLLGFQNCPKSVPSSVLIKVKSEDQIKAIVGDGKVCDLIVYFFRLQSTVPLPDALIRELQDLKFTDFFQKWTFKYKGATDEMTFKSYELQIPILPKSKRIWVVKRRNEGKSVIVRMNSVYITMGEIWYIRLLLLHKAAVSMIDLKTVQGVICKSFQDAAIKEGFVDDSLAAKLCFCEFRELQTPSELRTLFVTLTLNGYPTLLILDDDNDVLRMMADYLDDNQNNYNLCHRLLMLDLDRRFKASNHRLSEYGIAEPQSIISETEFMRMKYNCQIQLQLFHDLIVASPFTYEMQSLFNMIMDAVHNDRQELHVLQGQGGSGKSTFVKSLMAYVRSKDMIALGCASTGLAASIYEDFFTTHSLFGIPVVEEEDYDTIDDIEMQITQERRLLIQNASLIVWDEAFSNHSLCLTIVLKHFFDNISDNDTPKVLLLVGDNKQIAPVVKYGGKYQILQASIISHPAFAKFTITSFTKNLRLMNDVSERQVEFQKYAEMLLEVGAGSPQNHAIAKSPVDAQTSEQQLIIPCLSVTSDMKMALSFLHPNYDVDDDLFHTRCIVAGINML